MKKRALSKHLRDEDHLKNEWNLNNLNYTKQSMNMLLMGALFKYFSWLFLLGVSKMVNLFLGLTNPLNHSENGIAQVLHTV